MKGRDCDTDCPWKNDSDAALNWRSTMFSLVEALQLQSAGYTLREEVPTPAGSHPFTKDVKETVLRNYNTPAQVPRDLLAL